MKTEDEQNSKMLKFERNMTLNRYQELAQRTAKRFEDPKMDLVHAAMGASSDAGELLSEVKAHFIYGKALDVDHLIEEIGDTLWFLQLACASQNLTLGYVASKNLEKLAVRYPEKYTDEHAIQRLDKQ